MSSEFDPYRIWLGIPVNEQPANYYRLLGLAIFEADDDVISNAADRQMTHVRTFQTGKYSAQSQQVLNELSTARITLLDKTKKAAYDKQLQAKIQPQVVVTPVAVAIPATPVIPPAFNVDSSTNNVVLGINTTSGDELSELSLLAKKNAEKREKHEKRSKAVPTHTVSKRPAGKPSKSDPNTKIFIFSGIGGAVVILVVFLLLLSGSHKSTSSNTPPEDYDSHDYSNVQVIPQISNNSYNADYQKQERERRKKEREARNKAKNQKASSEKASDAPQKTEADGFQKPVFVGDTPKLTKYDGEGNPISSPDTNNANANNSATPDSASENDSNTSTDMDTLLKKEGLAKTYSETVPQYTLPLDTKKKNSYAQTAVLDLKSDTVGFGQKNGKVQLLDLASGTSQDCLAGGNNQLAVLKNSPDGKVLLRACNPTKQQIMDYQAIINAADFLESDGVADVRPRSGIVRWNQTDFQNKVVIEYRGYQILNMAVSPVNGESGYVAVALNDGLIHLINLESNTDFLCFVPGSQSVPQRRWIKQLPDDIKYKFRKYFYRFETEVLPTSIDFNKDSRHLATGNSAGEVCVWNTDQYEPATDNSDSSNSNSINSLVTIKQTFTQKLSDSPVIQVSFNPATDSLFAVWEDGNMGEWDWMTGKLIQKHASGKPLQYAATTDKGKYVVAQSEDGQVDILTWDTPRVKPIATLLKSTDTVIANPNKNYFLATEKGAANPQLQMFTLPDDFQQADKNAEFTKFFRTYIVLPVPPEEQLKAKVEEAQALVNKHLGDSKADSRIEKISEMAAKLANLKEIDPALRYDLYQYSISQMAQEQEIDKTLQIAEQMGKVFDADSDLLQANALMELLKNKLKRVDLQSCADKAMPVAERLMESGKKDIARQIAFILKDTDYYSYLDKKTIERNKKIIRDSKE